MTAFWAVVKKELSSVGRDRTILIAVLIQLFIASFSSVLLIGLLSLYDADSAGLYNALNIRVALVGDRDGVLTGFLEQRGFQVLPYPTTSAAEPDFFAGQVRAILELPPTASGAPATGSDLVQMRLFLPAEETSATLVLNQLQEPLKRYENTLRVERQVQVRYTGLKGQPPTTFEFIYSVILPMLMFFPAFVAGGMVVDSLSEEVENNTFETLLSAPLTPNIAITAKIAAALILTAVQCLAWLGLLYMNGIEIHNRLLVLLLAIITAGIVTVLAATTAVALRDRERSQFVFSLVLLAVTSASYLLNFSPIQTISRLAIGDYYTGPLQVLAFAGVLALLLVVLLRMTRLVKG
jgi:ABC-2 type transport system permease protein